jgi:hypothetical protein
MRKLLTIAALAALAASGCDAGTIAGTVGNAVGSPKVRVSGKAYGPATQVAIVAAGGGNYILNALPGEAPAGGAKVSLSGGGTAVADTAGAYMIEVPAGVTYKATVTFKTKAGGEATLVGVAPVGASAATIDLDAVNYMVGSKMYAEGKSPDAAKITEALTKMRAAMAGKSAPEFTGQDAAAAAFDANATADVKAALGL